MVAGVMNFESVEKSNSFHKLMQFLIFSWLGLCFGCAALLERKPPEEDVLSVEKWNLKSYAQFLQQNMKAMNEKYTMNYIPYSFVVDTEDGSTLIQNLINSKSVAPIVDQLKVASLEQEEQILKLYQYVLEEYDYIQDAYHWPRVEETLRTKKGDCKGMSLLLMSLWTVFSKQQAKRLFAATDNLKHQWFNERKAKLLGCSYFRPSRDIWFSVPKSKVHTTHLTVNKYSPIYPYYNYP